MYNALSMTRALGCQNEYKAMGFRFGIIVQTLLAYRSMAAAIGRIKQQSQPAQGIRRAALRGERA